MRNDPIGGCLAVIVVLLVLAGMVAWGGGYLLEQWEGVKQADAAVEQQQTIQQRDYLAYLAAMAAMGSDDAADPVPWWVTLLLIIDASLLVYLACIKYKGGNP